MNDTRKSGFTLIELPAVRPFDRLRASKRERVAFTLIELLVVIAIISLLVSILLPSLNQAKELARQTICATNQRSMGTAVFLYADDSDGFVEVSNRNDR